MTTEPGKHVVKFHLSHGGYVEFDMTSDELTKSLRGIDHGAVIGSFNRDLGHQTWIRSEHIVAVEHPLEMGVDWIAIRDEDNPSGKIW